MAKRKRQAKESVKPNKDIAEIETELSRRINRCSVIINELKNNAAFNMVIEDFEEMIEKIDSTWHLIPANQMDKLLEMRITKLAADSVLKIIANYEHDYDRCQKQLAEIKHPDIVQGSYYDRE